MAYLWGHVNKSKANAKNKYNIELELKSWKILYVIGRNVEMKNQNILFAKTTVMEDVIGKTKTLLGKVTNKLGEIKVKLEVFAHLERLVVQIRSQIKCV